MGARTSPDSTFNGSITGPLDAISGAVRSIDHAHYKIHAGDHYYHKGYESIPNSGEYELLFDVGPGVYPHLTFLVSHEYEMEIAVLEDVSVTGAGTVITPINRNRNSGNASAVTLTHTPNGVAGGTTIYSGRAGDNKKAGGLSRAESEIVLLQDALTLIRLTNQSASANLVDFIFDWYE